MVGMNVWRCSSEEAHPQRCATVWARRGVLVDGV